MTTIIFIVVVIGMLGATTLFGKSEGRLPWSRRGRPRVYRNHPLAREWGLPGWLAIVWSLVLALGAFAAGAVERMDSKLPKDSWPWVHEPKTQLWFGLTFAVVVFVDSIRRLFSHLGSAKESAQREDIRKQMRSLLASVSDQATVKVGDLGCGLFLVHRSWRSGVRLKRVERVRLLSTVSESGVIFRPGVGTVGACWNARNPDHRNWVEINKRYANNKPSLPEWEGTRQDTKHGFDYESWKIMIGRHAEVLAVPITTVGGKLLGVLAIDRKWHEDDPDSPPRLNTRPIRSSVGLIADTLVPLL